LRQTLSESPTPLRNKVVYATPRGVDRISQSDIDAAAVALNVVEELRPEGKFWSLPKSETQSKGSEGSEGSVEKHNA